MDDNSETEGGIGLCFLCGQNGKPQYFLKTTCKRCTILLKHAIRLEQSKKKGSYLPKRKLRRRYRTSMCRHILLVARLFASAVGKRILSISQHLSDSSEEDLSSVSTEETTVSDTELSDPENEQPPEADNHNSSDEPTGSDSSSSSSLSSNSKEPTSSQNSHSSDADDEQTSNTDNDRPSAAEKESILSSGIVSSSFNSSNPPFNEWPTDSHWFTIRAISSADSIFSSVSSSSFVNQPINNDVTDTLKLILCSANEQLLRLLKWTRQLPFFGSRLIPEADVFTVLGSNWIKLLLIAAAFNSLEVDSGVVLANGIHLIPSEAWTACLQHLIENFHESLVKPFSALQVDSVERAILRTMVLLDPGPEFVLNTGYFNGVRRCLHAQLQAYAVVTGKSAMHCMHAMQLLDPLKEVSQQCSNYLKTLRLSTTDAPISRLASLVEQEQWAVEDRQSPSNEVSSHF